MESRRVFFVAHLICVITCDSCEIEKEVSDQQLHREKDNLVDGSGIQRSPPTNCMKPYSHWGILKINWLAGFLPWTYSNMLAMMLAFLTIKSLEKKGIFQEYYSPENSHIPQKMLGGNTILSFLNWSLFKGHSFIFGVGYLDWRSTEKFHESLVQTVWEICCAGDNMTAVLVVFTDCGRQAATTTIRDISRISNFCVDSFLDFWGILVCKKQTNPPIFGEVKSMRVRRVFFGLCYNIFLALVFFIGDDVWELTKSSKNMLVLFLPFWGWMLIKILPQLDSLQLMCFCC